MSTIFGKIIRGEIPCWKVYEDPQVLAFLDVNPVARGHTLVVPKQPAATFADLSDDAAGALGRTLPRICRAIVKTTGCRGYNLLQNNGQIAGQLVMHAHVHIIPRYDRDGFTYSWPAAKLDAAQGAELAGLLRTNMEAS